MVTFIIMFICVRLSVHPKSVSVPRMKIISGEVNY